MGRLDIAKRLKYLREMAGLTQKQVGEKVGKAYQTVASWESGQGQPDADTFMLICKLYGVENMLTEFGYGAEAREIDCTKQPPLDRPATPDERKPELTDRQRKLVRLNEMLDRVPTDQLDAITSLFQSAIDLTKK